MVSALTPECVQWAFDQVTNLPIDERERLIRYAENRMNINNGVSLYELAALEQGRLGSYEQSVPMHEEVKGFLMEDENEEDEDLLMDDVQEGDGSSEDDMDHEDDEEEEEEEEEEEAAAAAEDEYSDVEVDPMDEEEEEDNDDDEEDEEDDITYRITDANVVILEGLGGDGNFGRMEKFFKGLHVEHAFLEYTLRPFEMIVRWVILDPEGDRKYLFADAPTFGELLRCADKEEPMWFQEALHRKYHDVYDNIGKAREVDYETGRIIYGICQYLIMKDAIRYEPEGQRPASFEIAQCWIPVMKDIVTTMVERYGDRYPNMEETFRGYHDEFLALLRRQFSAKVDIAEEGSLSISCLDILDHCRIAASAKATLSPLTGGVWTR